MLKEILISSGCCNRLCRVSDSAVVSGINNHICYNSAGLGTGAACCSFIGGGGNNFINQAYSAIIGGLNNCVKHTHSFIIGSNICTSVSDATYMNNTIITGSLTVGGGVQLSTTLGRIDAKNDILAYSTSDRRLKENITPIEHAVDKVERITGVNFDWKELTEEEKIYIHGNEGHDIGVIAQEIEKVLPNAVTTRDSGYKAVNYEKIIPLLIEAIKDQQKQIDELKRKI